MPGETLWLYTPMVQCFHAKRTNVTKSAEKTHPDFPKKEVYAQGQLFEGIGES